MSTIVRKPITYRITTTYTKNDGTEGVETMLMNFSREPTQMRLRLIAKMLVDPDIIGYKFKSYTAERIGS